MRRLYLVFLVISLMLCLLNGCNTANSPVRQPSTEGQNPASDPNTVPNYALVDAYPNLLFKQPVEYVQPGDGSNRVFVVEKAGKILVFENEPQVAVTQVFLDLSSRVDSSSNEKGLLGLAFHPHFAQNGYFYVNYTTRTSTVIARYQVQPDQPGLGLTNSEQVLLTIAQPYSNHNGGHLAFGPDGYLYIGMGDGGSAGDPQGNGQNLNTLLGKMLRIDVDQNTNGRLYNIPADNPFAGNQDGYREEIYAYGFRNPWKFSFDVKNSRLWVADVGQNTMEEIDIVQKGLNYGWNIMEGSLCYPESRTCSRTGLELPLWDYRHPIGNSITGGYVYYGSNHPSLAGAYVYGDYVSGMIWALTLDTAYQPQNKVLLDTKLNISAFGVDQNQELYVVDYGGKIYKLTD